MANVCVGTDSALSNHRPATAASAITKTEASARLRRGRFTLLLQVGEPRERQSGRVAAHLLFATSRAQRCFQRTSSSQHAGRSRGCSGLDAKGPPGSPDTRLCICTSVPAGNREANKTSHHVRDKRARPVDEPHTCFHEQAATSAAGRGRLPATALRLWLTRAAATVSVAA